MGLIFRSGVLAFLAREISRSSVDLLTGILGDGFISIVWDAPDVCPDSEINRFAAQPQSGQVGLRQMHRRRSWGLW